MTRSAPPPDVSVPGNAELLIKGGLAKPATNEAWADGHYSIAKSVDACGNAASRAYAPTWWSSCWTWPARQTWPPPQSVAVGTMLRKMTATAIGLM
jgi:hypothetical protein